MKNRIDVYREKYYYDTTSPSCLRWKVEVRSGRNSTHVNVKVGDVAGMGADLYESYCGAILATACLGATAFSNQDYQVQFNTVVAPMIIGAVG